MLLYTIIIINDGESRLSHLVGHVVAGHDAEVVALGNVAFRGKANGESLLQTDIVRGLVLREFEGYFFNVSMIESNSLARCV